MIVPGVPAWALVSGIPLASAAMATAPLMLVAVRVLVNRLVTPLMVTAVTN